MRKLQATPARPGAGFAEKTPETGRAKPTFLASGT